MPARRLNDRDHHLFSSRDHPRVWKQCLLEGLMIETPVRRVRSGRHVDETMPARRLNDRDGSGQQATTNPIALETMPARRLNDRDLRHQVRGTSRNRRDECQRRLARSCDVFRVRAAHDCHSMYTMGLPSLTNRAISSVTPRDSCQPGICTTTRPRADAIIAWSTRIQTSWL